MGFIVRANGARDPHQYRHDQCVNSDVDNADTTAHQKLSYHIALTYMRRVSSRITILDRSYRDVRFGSKADNHAVRPDRLWRHARGRQFAAPRSLSAVH